MDSVDTGTPGLTNGEGKVQAFGKLSLMPLAAGTIELDKVLEQFISQLSHRQGSVSLKRFQAEARKLSEHRDCYPNLIRAWILSNRPLAKDKRILILFRKLEEVANGCLK